VSDPVFDPVLSFNMRVYRGIVSIQSNTISANGFDFGSVPVTALLVYLFQLVPVIFTYLCADCPCDVTTFLHGFDVIWATDPVGSGHGSKILTRFHLWRVRTT